MLREVIDARPYDAYQRGLDAGRAGNLVCLILGAFSGAISVGVIWLLFG